jgi:cobalt-zinc-cadmium resistance protein CzcA
MKNKARKKLKTKELSNLLICLLTIVNCQFLISQTPINLQAAIDTALKNNLTVKNEKLKSDYQKKIIKTSASIPQTNIIGEYGQLNSYYNDNRFGVSQSFNFPTVYIKQKQLLNEEWKTSIMTVTLKEAETKKYVRQTFYTYLYLKEKEKLLLKNDSIYANFLEKTNLRFSKGESNILEKTTAESQRGNYFYSIKTITTRFRNHSIAI